MNDIIDRVDESISAQLAGRRPAFAGDTLLSELLETADSLRLLPRPEFRARLREDLLAAAERRAACPERAQRAEGSSPVGAMTSHSSDLMVERTRLTPSFFSIGSGTLPVSGSHLAISFGLHVVALALIAASGWWMVENQTVVRTKVAQLIPGSEDFLLPVAPGKMGGGGGGGDRDKMAASHGTAPRFASEQLTPPAVVVRNEDPRLPVEPTVIGPPNVLLPQSDRYGDPMAAILNPPSNGTGSGDGIGAGFGNGVGPGEGSGVAEGRGGGIGGGVLRVGGGVSAPRPVYDPEPEYSEQARKAKFQGSVLLSAIIGSDGRPRDLRVVRSLGMGLDQKALDAVWKWRFSPATKDGHPVAVEVSIEVAFHLY